VTGGKKKKGSKSRDIQRAPRIVLKIDIFSHYHSVTLQQPVMSAAAAEIASVSSEFDIFAHRQIQTSVLGTIEAEYKPNAPVDHNDPEFFVPADNDTYIDLDIKLYALGKLISASGKDVVFSDHTGVTNNFLHSLFSQCNVTLNGVTFTHARGHYRYRSNLETLLAYGTDAAVTQLSNSYCYLDTGDMQPVDSSARNVTATTNRGFILRWKRISASRKVHLFGRLHSDICNVPYTCCGASGCRSG